jgi:hypothetical protein
VNIQESSIVEIVGLLSSQSKLKRFKAGHSKLQQCPPALFQMNGLVQVDLSCDVERELDQLLALQRRGCRVTLYRPEGAVEVQHYYNQGAPKAHVDETTLSNGIPENVSVAVTMIPSIVVEENWANFDQIHTVAIAATSPVPPVSSADTNSRADPISNILDNPFHLPSKPVRPYKNPFDDDL